MAKNSITGGGRVYGVMGDPIRHSFSPTIHNKIYEYMNEDAVYVPFHVLPDGLERAVKGAYALGIRGINVTLPHKINVMKFLCGCDSAAAEIGAVNTLEYTDDGYKGYNTDVIGVEHTFSLRNIELKGRSCLLIGAGGAADAVCYALLRNGASKVYIANRTVSKAYAIKERLESGFDTEIVPIALGNADDVRGVDMVLNGTTLGFGENKHMLPVSIDLFRKNEIEICFDVIYTPWRTEFLKLGADCGAKCINGFDMLIYQGTAAAEIWFEKKFDKDFLYKIRNELKEIFINKEGKN